jgi:hypothetical protein
MINELMMRFAQIRSSYARKRFGNLSNEDKALIDYESFCLELIKEVDQLKEVIEEVRELVYKMFNNEPANSREYDYYCEKLLQILDKVKKK